MIGAILATFGPSIDLRAVFLWDIALDPTDAGCSCRIDNDGGFYEAQNGVSGGASIKKYNWVNPPSAASLFECAYTGLSGAALDTTPGAVDTWFACTADRTWGQDRTTLGEDDTTFTLKLRLVNGTAERTNSAQLKATVDI